MRVFVTGATGLIGSLAAKRLRERGDVVLGLSRRPAGDPALVAGIEWVQGDATAAGPWQARLDGMDAVVNLVGEPIDARRWSFAHRQRMLASRIESTRRLVESMQRAERRPKALLCASATGFYGPRGEEELDEGARPGPGFLAALAQAWEAEGRKAEALGVRWVALRFAPLLSMRGGALLRLLPIFKLYAGGPLGRPRNWYPWIHEDDAIGLIQHALDRLDLSGPINAVAPGLVRMRDFTRALGKALHRPALLPVPRLVLRILLGEIGNSISPGQKVVPKVALASGYRFAHPDFEPALCSLLGP